MSGTNNKNADNYKKELLFIPFVMAQSLHVLAPKPLQTEILSECDKSVVLGLMITTKTTQKLWYDSPHCPPPLSRGNIRDSEFNVQNTATLNHRWPSRPKLILRKFYYITFLRLSHNLFLCTLSLFFLYLFLVFIKRHSLFFCWKWLYNFFIWIWFFFFQN